MNLVVETSEKPRVYLELPDPSGFLIVAFTGDRPPPSALLSDRLSATISGTLHQIRGARVRYACSRFQHVPRQTLGRDAYSGKVAASPVPSCDRQPYTQRDDTAVPRLSRRADVSLETRSPCGFCALANVPRGPPPMARFFFFSVCFSFFPFSGEVLKVGVCVFPVS